MIETGLENENLLIKLPGHSVNYLQLYKKITKIREQNYKNTRYHQIKLSITVRVFIVK